MHSVFQICPSNIRKITATLTLSQNLKQINNLYIYYYDTNSFILSLETSELGQDSQENTAC